MKNVNTDVTYVTLITIVAAIGGLLFGYDTAVISGAIGFVRDYFELNPAMMGWIASSALVGCVAGCAVAGYLSDRFGRRRVLLLAAILFSITGIGCAIVKNTSGLVIYRIIGGLGVGIASMLSPVYIAEIAPAHMRGRLVSYNQFAIITGMIAVYFVNYLIAARGNESWNLQSGWRWMFGSETIPALLFLGSLIFIPESPRWLAKNNMIEKSRQILLKIGGPEFAEKELKEIRETEISESQSLRALFSSKFRIALFIGIVLAILQQVTGINVFMYYAPEIFKKLGSGTNAALLQTIIVGFFNMGFTVVAIMTVDRFGWYSG
jgi:sugar porter (SP) family MFS transporter